MQISWQQSPSLLSHAPLLGSPQRSVYLESRYLHVQMGALRDCSFPPELPNAIQSVGDQQSFPEKFTVTYKCKEGFVKVPGKADSVVCLNNKWSEVAEFCNRSCDVPTRLQFASLKKSFTKQNYFPVGSVVEYECRPGYQRDHLLSGKLTCLLNFTWSKPDEFCKRKSCPNPGDLRHGHVNIPTDILYAAVIHFSCNKGYRLVGAASSYCSIVNDDVGWSDPLPECQGKTEKKPKLSS
uniref:Sushi domain-containing protein n=1 Tax=Neovison vison TaxID=452646 RepID=A0A8C7AWS8_NEOVI